MGNDVNFLHQSPATTVVLLIVTCSIYYFVLLYKWIEAVNGASDKPKLDPVLAIILSFITCGLASIYFEYEIAERVEKIIQEKKANNALRTDGMRPPVDNLKGIVLFGSLASYAVSFFSAGFLAAVAFVFTIWLCCAIQYAIEYSVDTPQD